MLALMAEGLSNTAISARLSNREDYLMPTVKRVTEINAPASTVWKILADTAAYPQWNPFMTRFDGTFQPGAKLTVTIEPPGSKPQTFKPTVTEVESGRHVSW